MNCLEFRRQLLIEPRARDEALMRHEQACPACAAFAQTQARHETLIERALRVEPPPGLVARVILNQTMHRGRRLRWLALAAGVLLMLSTAGGLLFWMGPGALERTVIAHINEERELLAVTGSVPDAKLAEVLRTLGIEPAAVPGNVRYAGICPVGRQLAAHLVVAGDRGPVTVLVMPRAPVTDSRTFQRAEFYGIIVPAGTGSLAVVGEPGEPVQEIARRLQAQLYPVRAHRPVSQPARAGLERKNARLIIQAGLPPTVQ